MRTDTDLMTRVAERFRDATPTADGLADRRTLPTPTGLPVRADLQMARIPLGDLLEHRSSSLTYAAERISATQLFGLVREALRRDATDWGTTAEELPLEVYTFALRPADVDEGVYRITVEDCHRVADLPDSEHWDDLGVQREFAGAGAIVSAAGDLDRADSWAGAHGYRILMGRAAAAIYDVHLGAVAEGWVGTVFAGFIPAAVRVSLASDGASRQQLFATTVAIPLTVGKEVTP